MLTNNSTNLDKTQAKRITTFLRQNILTLDNPKQIGKPLTGNMAGLWRYRLGDYRIICDIKENILVVLVLGVGHRKQIYNKRI